MFVFWEIKYKQLSYINSRVHISKSLTTFLIQEPVWEGRNQAVVSKTPFTLARNPTIMRPHSM